MLDDEGAIVKKPDAYCSSMMFVMLQNIAAGNPPTDGLGAAALGGAPGTRAALRSRGWIDSYGGISLAGREYLASRGIK